MFWTMNPTEDDPRQSVTLCEEHALQETNEAVAYVGLGDPFGSMAEAYAVMSALAAMSGGDYGLTSSETGDCPMCEDETQALSASQESA